MKDYTFVHRNKVTSISFRARDYAEALRLLISVVKDENEWERAR